MKVKIGTIIILLLLFFFSNLVLAQSIKERLQLHVEILASDSLEGRGLGTVGKEKAERYIAQQFGAVGLLPYLDQFEHRFEFRSGLAWIPAVNFIGLIPGSDPVLKDEYIIVGAHYDHLGYSLKDDEKTIFPGADDNASGVAAIIEVARDLISRQSELKRSVLIVAFDAEESGLIGAERIVSSGIIPLNQIKLMFSLDMVGMYSSYGGLDLKGVESLENGASIANEVAKRHNINLKKMGSAIEMRTDTKPFGDVGIPSAHVFTGLKSPYHKPQDKADLLDYDGMVKVHAFMTDLVQSYGNAAALKPISLLASLGPDNDTKRKKSKIRADLGLLINYGSGYHRYSDDFFNAKNGSVFNVGLTTRVHFSKYFSVALDHLYDMNGSQSAEGRFRRQSFTESVNLQISTPTAASGFRLYAFVGPYYRYNFSAKSGDLIYDPGDNGFNRNEWGISSGLGFDVKKFTIGWTWRSGLTPVLGTNVGSRRIDNNSMFTLGMKLF